MPDPRHIPFLVRLLDDDSELVQYKVREALASFGLNLNEEIHKISFSLNPTQEKRLNVILDEIKMAKLKAQWSKWFTLGNDYLQLECALNLLSEYLEPNNPSNSLTALLDDLAQEYQEHFIQRDPVQLARFLFKIKQMKGDQQNYYNPQNSNLFYVLREKKGIPISLAAIYMLVGNRLNLNIEGCNFPGHFLARVSYRGQTFFVDCFGSGRIINKNEIAKLHKEGEDKIDFALDEKIYSETIVHRFLANMIRAFQINNDEVNANFLIELFKDIDIKLLDNKFAVVTPEDIIYEKQPLFKIGEVVYHKRYGYRGLIVDRDPFCKATDQWYFNNQTQPPKDEFWYHVLVHDSDQITYVAQSNICKDHSLLKIQHPLLSHFFNRGPEGQYLRNNTPWPGGDF